MASNIPDPRHGAPRAAAENAAFAPDAPRAFPIHEFCRRYGIGRTTAYAEIAAGRLHAVKVGQRTLIAHDAAEAWLAALPEMTTRSRSLTPNGST